MAFIYSKYFHLPQDPSDNGEMFCNQRTGRIFLTLGGLTLMVLSFQNFSNIALEDLRPEFSRARIAGRGLVFGSRDDQDIRDFAPTRPVDFGASDFALPDSGRDPSTIGLNWLGKQTHLMTNGGDQRALDDINKSLKRMVKFTPVDGEPWPETGSSDASGRNPASQDGNDPGDGGNSNDNDPNTPQIPKSIQDMFSTSPMGPHSIRFTQLNRFDVAFNNRAHLNCMVGNGGVELDLQKSVNDRMDVGLRHQTNGQASTFHVNYNW